VGGYKGIGVAWRGVAACVGSSEENLYPSIVKSWSTREKCSRRCDAMRCDAIKSIQVGDSIRLSIHCRVAEDEGDSMHGFERSKRDEDEISKGSKGI
jgi:hypothetical protein